MAPLEAGSIALLLPNERVHGLGNGLRGDTETIQQHFGR
jgi:hypothetical protein